MATFQVTPPEQFPFTKPEEWPKWSRRFERFRIASGLVEKDDPVQISTLIYSMGSEADDILASFNLSEEDRKDFKKVHDKFSGYFVVRRNTIFERAKFNMRKQGDTETVDSFVTALYTLAEHCEYGSLHDEMIRDRIVVGLRDERLAEKMQLDETLTLEKAINQARQSEAVKKQQSVVRNDVENASSRLDAVHFNKKHSKPSLSSASSRSSSKPTSDNKYKSPGPKRYTHKSVGKNGQSCGRCGQHPKHDRNSCPAKDALCHKCKIKGHFAKVCRTARNIDQICDDSDSAFLGAVDCNDQPWTVNLQLSGVDVEFKIDTGADVSVIPESVYLKVGKFPLNPSDKKLYGPGLKKLEVKGKFRGSLSLNRKVIHQDVYVVKDLRIPLLGRPAIEALNLLSRVQVDRVDDIGTPLPNIPEMFPKLFTGLGKIEGDYQIKLNPDAVPYSLNTPRRVPLPLLPKVRAELDEMQAKGIIDRIDEPTDWCAGMVVVPKSNGKIRICVDLTNLNKSVKREKHLLPKVDHTLGQLAGAKVFSKLDANSGFYQIELSKESSPLTTFITPFGRYYFRRLPFGISSAPEHFQKRMSEILDGLEGVVCQTDDVLVYGSTQEEHDRHLVLVLKRLEESGITLNRDKCEFSKPQIKFVGHVIGHDGISPDPDKISAITEMDPPTDISGVRRFLGMVNQMGKFSSSLAEESKPLRDLLGKRNQWVWGDRQQRAFDNIKRELSSRPILALYDSTRETIVSADASSFGLGSVLIQIQDDGSKRAVAYASRAMSDTERRYAQIEKEALSITWACDRFSDYLIGKEFHIETDHKPLVPLLGKKDLSDLPPRVQRFRLRLMRFSYTISHVPGKDLYTPDTLSRAPVRNTAEDEFASEVSCYVDSIMQNIPATDRKLAEISKAQSEDSVCQSLRFYVENDWPNDKSLVNENVKPYWQFRGEITVQNNLLLRGSRLIIPAQLRSEMLEKLHDAHMGIVKCRERAQNSVWWPGLSSQIENTVKDCAKCSRYQPDQAEPLLVTAFPDRPWQKVGTDLFNHNANTFLLVIDYFSRYIEVAKLDSLTSENVIAKMKSIFSRHGIPEEVISDNGPQYASEVFVKFSKEYEFVHTTSSPRYPQSNGEAERGVRTVKQLLNKTSDPCKALLSYRSTPLANGYSPSELLFGRQIRSFVPTIPGKLDPEWPYLKDVRMKEQFAKQQQKQNYDVRHRARVLKPLVPGNTVWIKDYKHPGFVVAPSSSPRSYVVKTEDGVLLRRNRRHLVPTTERLREDSAWEDIPVRDADESEDSTPDPPQKDSLSQSPDHYVTRSGRIIKPPTKLDL